MSVDPEDVTMTLRRARALASFRERHDFGNIYNAFNRVIRILPGTFDDDGDGVDEGLLQDQSEIDLYRSVSDIKDEIVDAAKSGEYEKALSTLADLTVHIDRFFDDVLVMVEQKDVQTNRLRLLKQLTDMICLTADFSKLVE